MSGSRFVPLVCASAFALSFGCASGGPSANLAHTTSLLPVMQHRLAASKQSWTNLPYVVKNGAFPVAVALGADGNYWIADAHNGIVRMNPVGKITLFALPQNSGQPGDIVRGHGDDLWFTSSFNNPWVGRITTGGAITLLPLPYGSFSAGIARGLSGTGSMWFTDPGAGKIGRISADSNITEFAVPNGVGTDIALGPDGNMWFTSSSKVGRITPKGEITEFPAAANLYSIAAGPGKYISYSSVPIDVDTYIYIITTDGQPHAQVDVGRNVYSTHLLSPPQGELWATVFYGGVLSELDRITSDGFLTQFPPQQFSQYGNDLTGFAFATDGSVWIGDVFGQGIDVFRRQ